MSELVGKIAYGILFCLVVPLLLALWASTLQIELPMPSPGGGSLITAAGVVVMILGMINLWIYGKGLPMNAFPPRKFVSEGIYSFLKHPIYVGFCMACTGVSLQFQSAPGLYLITPVAMLCCTALVKGYEVHFLREKLGAQPEGPPAGVAQRIARLIPLLLFLGAGMEWLRWLVYSGTSVFVPLHGETGWPVISWFASWHILAYPVVIITPLLIGATQFNDYLRTAWILALCGLFLQFIFPFDAVTKPYFLRGIAEDFFLWEQQYPGTPFYLMVFNLLSARSFLKAGRLSWMVASVIAIAIVVQAVVQGIAGVVVFFLVDNRESIITRLQRWSESLANSWSEWRWGGFRIISHATYSGLAGFAAGFILSQFTPNLLHLDLILLSALLGGALWGQWLEGSPSMLRPFGYYGAILGGMIAMIIIWISSGTPIVYWLGVFAMATPLSQAIGRLRCVVQGCCHGRRSFTTGIHYYNPHTRVAQIPELQGKMIHNTPGYSIVSNVLIALVLFRLQFAGASPGILGGLYFILTGCARFVEESYRGEPQTRTVYGLRWYQWMAMASMVFGAVVTTIPCDCAITFSPTFTWPVWLASAFSGLIWAFGLSMDFPRSKARFGRLTG